MITGCTGGRGEWLEYQHRDGSFSRGSADGPVQGQCPACLINTEYFQEQSNVQTISSLSSTLLIEVVVNYSRCGSSVTSVSSSNFHTHYGG